MEKHYKFSIWYVLLGIWVVLLVQEMIVSAFAIQTIPYSQFLKKLTLLSWIIPTVIFFGELYARAKEILNDRKNLLTKGAKLLLEQEKIDGDDIKALMIS
jgi:hypothetical protein